MNKAARAINIDLIQHKQKEKSLNTQESKNSIKNPLVIFIFVCVFVGFQNFSVVKIPIQIDFLWFQRLGDPRYWFLCIIANSCPKINPHRSFLLSIFKCFYDNFSLQMWEFHNIILSINWSICFANSVFHKLWYMDNIFLTLFLYFNERDPSRHWVIHVKSIAAQWQQ